MSSTPSLTDSNQLKQNENVLNQLDTILEKDDVLFVISDGKKENENLCPGRLVQNQNSYNHLHGQIISSTNILGDCCGQNSHLNINNSLTKYTNPMSKNRNNVNFRNICSDDDGLCSSIFSNPRKSLSDWKSICQTYRSKDDIEINQMNHNQLTLKYKRNLQNSCNCEISARTSKKSIKADDILNDWKKKNQPKYKDYENGNLSGLRNVSPNDYNICGPSQQYVSYLSDTLKKLKNFKMEDCTSLCKDGQVRKKRVSKNKIENEEELYCKNCQGKLKKTQRNEQIMKTRKHLKSILKLKHGGSKYVNSPRIFYPGIKCGHKLCKSGNNGVPSYMGWNWNTDVTGVCRIKKGWRPGAIPKNIKEIMCHFLNPCPCDTLPVTNKKPNENTTKEQQEIECEVIQKPTLSVQKKDGDYLITMRPLKNTADLRNNPNPYLTEKPIKFKISRRAEEKKCDEIRALIKKKGFRQCTCGNIVACCVCRDNKEMDALRKCLNECEENYGVKSLEYKLCLKKSVSDPELDIEFTPPAGIAKKNVKKLPDVVYQETQYCEDDFKTVNMGAENGKNGSFDKTGPKIGKGGKLGAAIGKGGKLGAGIGKGGKLGFAPGGSKAGVSSDKDKSSGKIGSNSNKPSNDKFGKTGGKSEQSAGNKNKTGGSSAKPVSARPKSVK